VHLHRNGDVVDEQRRRQVAADRGAAHADDRHVAHAREVAR
jgi:hypothetical protein